MLRAPAEEREHTALLTKPSVWEQEVMKTSRSTTELPTLNMSHTSCRNKVCMYQQNQVTTVMDRTATLPQRITKPHLNFAYLATISVCKPQDQNVSTNTTAANRLTWQICYAILLHSNSDSLLEQFLSLLLPCPPHNPVH